MKNLFNTESGGKTPHFFLLILMTILLSALSFSDSYPHLGGDDRDFHFDERGQWNSQMSSDEWTSASKPLSDPKYYPLIADIDGDSIKEIVVRDGCSIIVYSPSQDETGAVLNVESTIGMTDCVAGEPWSNMDLADVDGDGYKEIIFASGDDDNEPIYLYQHDGTSLTLQSKFNCPDHSTNRLNDQVAIQCRDDGSCLRVMTLKRNGNIHRSIGITTFQNSCVENFEIVTEVTDRMHCLPGDLGIYIDDVDNDGEDEFIFSYLEMPYGGGTNEIYRIKEVSINSSNNIINVDSISRNVGADLVLSGSNFWCDGTGFSATYKPLSKYFTSVLALELDANNPDGKEIVFGAMTSQDTFRQYAMLQNGALMSGGIYPSVQHADGVLLSNPFETLSFPDSTRGHGWCTAGYDTWDNVVDFHCISPFTYHSKAVDNVEFLFSLDNLASPYNITYGEELVNYLAHSIQTSTFTEDGTDLDEVMNSYGVFSLIWDEGDYGEFPGLGCGTGDKCSAELLFKNPKDDSVFLASEVDNSNLNDLFVMTDSDITYIDDGYQNTPGYIDRYEITPCLDEVWKQNETVHVEIGVSDPFDGNTVSSRSILYYGLYEGGVNVKAYSSDDDLEFDGNYETESRAMAGDRSADDIHAVSILIRDVPSDTPVDGGMIDIVDILGNPENCSFIYDIYMCETNVTDLSATGEFEDDCETTPTLLKNNIDLSLALGDTLGEKYFPFDERIYLEADTDYILYTVPISRDSYCNDGIGDTWVTATDENLITNKIRGYKGMWPNGTVVVNNTANLLPRLFLYEIVDEFDSGWTAYQSPSAPDFLHSFEATEKVTSGTLRLMGRDSGRPEIENIIDLTFSVSEQGVTFGSCTSIVSIDNPYEEGGDPISEAETNVSLVESGLENLDETLGLGLGASVIYLIVLVIIIIAVLFKLPDSMQQDSTIVVAIISLIAIIGIIVGVKINLIGYGTLIVISVVFLGVLSFRYRGLVLGGT